MFNSTHTVNLQIGDGSGATPILVRPANKDDVEQIAKLNRTTDRFQMSTYTKVASPEELQYWVIDPRSIFIVASVAKNVIGYAHGVCVSPKWFFFDAIVIDPSSQRCGLGNHLYETLRKECRKLGIELIQGLVKDDHDRALEYWIARGFEVGCNCIWVEDWVEDE